MSNLGFADHVVKMYTPFLDASEHDLMYVGTKMPIPKFQEELIRGLCNEAQLVLKSQGSFLDLCVPICIIGDVHGNLRDLLRLLQNSIKTNYKFLFLGDYVDRGDFSLEVVTLLFALLVKYPKQFYLLRGNHEFKENPKDCSLARELREHYDSDALATNIFETFSWLPIAATINGKILCVHGGLSPRLEKVEQLRGLKMPITDLKDEMISDILWSDPNPMVASFIESPRGRGKLFGVAHTVKFLKDNNLKMLIRAHQCIEPGVQFMHKTIVSIFSTSYYNNDVENKAGKLLIDETCKLIPVKLTAYVQPKRVNATFFDAPYKLLLTPISKLYQKENTKMSSFLPLPYIKPGTARRNAPVSPLFRLQPLTLARKTKTTMSV